MTLKVIGAGMGRTGTASLKVAIEQLGLGRCYHMSEVMQNPASIEDWIAAADGKADWDSIFKEYSATVDNPGCGFWKELAEYYPDAKVILTLRDAEKWFESTNETIHSVEFAGFIKNSPWGEMIQKTVFDTMGNKMQDKDHMVSFFNRRTQEIIDTIAPERLLVYQIREGWDPLCNFLNVPVPDRGFPHINSRDETRELIASMLAASNEAPSHESMAEAAQKLHRE